MILRRLAVVATLSSVVLLAGCSGGPEGAVKGFYKALDKGDTEAAAGYLSGQIVDIFGDGKLQAALGQFASKMSQCGGLDGVSVELQGEGDTRHGTSRVSFDGECPDEENTVVVVKEDGDWKLGLGK